MSATTTRPTLAALVAAVRAEVPGAASLDDAVVADLVRTASTAKGAVWLVRRATGPGPATPTQTAGRWATARACLAALAEGGDTHAAALLARDAELVVANADPAELAA